MREISYSLLREAGALGATHYQWAIHELETRECMLTKASCDAGISSDGYRDYVLRDGVPN